jgi:hypothetical protein
LIDVLIRQIYHYSYQIYTPVSFDFENAWSNATIVLNKVVFGAGLHLKFQPLWSVWVAIGTAGAFYSALCLYRLVRSHDQYEEVRVQSWMFILASWLIPVAPLPPIILTDYVRRNQFADWYFISTWFFAALAGTFTLVFAIYCLARAEKSRRFVLWVTTAATILYTTAQLPPAGIAPEFLELRTTAVSLADRMPSAPLLGSYWDTYVFPALQPVERASIPIPFEGSYNRAPWLLEHLKASQNVVVAYDSLGDAVAANVSPEAWLWQYDTLLQLIESRWFFGADRTFALYRNVHSKELPYEMKSNGNSRDFCATKSPLVISVEPIATASVVILLNAPGPRRLVAEAVLSNDGLMPYQVQMTRNMNGHLYQAKLTAEPGDYIRGVRIANLLDNDDVGGTCVLRKLFVVDSEQG